jgi:membrane-associated protein
LLLDLSLSWLSSLHGFPAYGALFLLLFLCGVGLPMIAQDVLLLAAAGLGLQSIPLMLAAWLGIMAGDALTFYWGHHYGAKWVRDERAAHLFPPERLARWEEAARRIALPLCFVTRFLPGMRSTVFFASGTLRMPYRASFIGNGVGALVYVALLTYGVHSLGWTWQQLQAPIDHVDNLLTGALVLALVMAWLRARRRARA